MPMNKVIYAVVLLLGLSILFCSCEKESLVSNSYLLENKWWGLNKVEFCFNGKVVETTDRGKDFVFEKVYFHEGICNFLYEDGDQKAVSYVFNDNVLSVYSERVNVIKLTNKEAVVELLVGNDNGIVITYLSVSDRIIDTYNGKEIYESGCFVYYIDNNKVAIQVRQTDRGAWYDTARAYFTAE